MEKGRWKMENGRKKTDAIWLSIGKYGNPVLPVVSKKLRTRATSHPCERRAGHRKATCGSRCGKNCQLAGFSQG